MSADAWEMCPMCQTPPAKYPKGIEHLYGKIPQDEFLELSKKLENLQDLETVRLDYEVTIEDDGLMSIWATGKCSNCGAKWTHKMEYLKLTPRGTEK